MEEENIYCVERVAFRDGMQTFKRKRNKSFKLRKKLNKI